MRSAAASCRRFRCRGACGPAASSNSARRCASATRSTARRRSTTSRKRAAVPGRWCSSRCATKFAAQSEADVALTEFHDIVYREAPKPEDVAPPPKQAPSRATWERKWIPDDVLLFRYSALTFNGHRIHYDRRYVTEVEGYPGLIVHGPLIATLLLDLLAPPAARRGRRAVRIPGGAPGVRHQSVLRLRRAAGGRQDVQAVGEGPRGVAHDGRDGGRSQ